MSARVRSRRSTGAAAVLGVALCAALAAGCASPPPAAPPASAPGLAELLELPAERALYDGLRAYDDARYPQAESHLRRALAGGLRSARDRASAHKLLAFITCTSERAAECEDHFRAALAEDPGFQLNRSEAGHPQWGPVYRRVVPQ